MSANNQTLIKEQGGKFYVFENVNAESWADKTGGVVELSISGAKGVFDNRDDAFNFALEVDRADDQLGGTEYGVQFNRLCKDDAEVKLIP